MPLHTARIGLLAASSSARSRCRLQIGTTALLALCASMSAGASEDLAREKGCLSCHAVQTKMVGPAYKDVAAKYAGQADAENKLVQKVLKGGQGNWGFIPMPANTGVSDADARSLVKWILSTKS